MTGGERGKLPAPIIEERIARDDEGTGLLAHQVYVGGVDLW
jgi:hypothetical protein